MIGKLLIKFVPTETEYDYPKKTNVFSVYLNLDFSTTTAKENSSNV